jgi:spermidine synthase
MRFRYPELNSSAVSHSTPTGVDAAAALPSSAAPRTAWLLMAMSGFAGLALQIAWTYQFGIWLGHEAVAVLAVIAGFFGGLALGAFALGPRILRSRHPGRWYAGLEAGIGLWALLLALAMPHAGAWLTVLIGAQPDPVQHWGFAFAGTFLLLLPASAAMGATLPAMQRVLDRLANQGYALGGLSAANTAGAMAGALAAAFVLAPAFGYTATTAVAAVLNLACAAIAWTLFGAQDRTPGAAGASAQRRPALLWLLALTGLLGIGYEVIVIRVLARISENTVHTYTLVLAVYLAGTAAGAALYQRHLAGAPDGARLRARLLAALALCCVAGLYGLGFGEQAGAALQQAIGAGVASAIGAEALAAALAFVLPTMAMGALFSHLCVEARDAGWSFGTAIAANTLGAALAAPVFGVALLPWLGAEAVLAAIALGYVALLPRSAWRGLLPWTPLAAGAAAVLAAPGLDFLKLPEGGRVISHSVGAMASVSVIEDAQGVRRLHIDNRAQEGSNVTRVADARQAWIPLLLHPEPRTALFLGLGTGVTAAAAAAEPGLRVDAVELLPEVADAAALFVPGLGEPGSPGTPRVLIADARRFVRAGAERYDVVVSDLFHPARSGSAALYTVEHFAAVRRRLAGDGVFCQWLPLHQMDLDTMRSIVRAFLEVWPKGAALLATNSLDTPVIGLVSRADDRPLLHDGLAARLEAARSAAALQGLQLDDAFAVPGSLVADAASLARFAAGAPANRDDRPVVAHRAPRATYAPEATPRERLRAFLAQSTREPALLFGSARPAAEWRARVIAYWSARDRYLEAGMAVRPSPDLRAMLAQVQAPLLEVLGTSPDFRPAREPLRAMAGALAREDAAAAQALIDALPVALPLRPPSTDSR